MKLPRPTAIQSLAPSRQAHRAEASQPPVALALQLIQIKNVDFTLSEVVDIFRQTIPSWKTAYEGYVLKMDGQSFDQYIAVEDRLQTYLDKEAEILNDGGLSEAKKQQRLARLRGTQPTLNSAMHLKPVAAGEIPLADRAAMQSLLATGGTGAGISDQSAHVSDPETGFRNTNPSVSVKEFYVNGGAGRRATQRVEGGRTTYYYSPIHTQNTYQYQRVY